MVVVTPPAPERQRELMRDRWASIRADALHHLELGDGGASDADFIARLVRRAFGDIHRTSWAAMGVEVHLRPLGHSGMLTPREWPIQVLVEKRDGPARRRFTVAHELGHYVMRGAEHLVSPASVEGFCDAFASELLVPHAQLRALTAGLEGIPSAEETVELARRLGVNFTPIIYKLPSLRTRRPCFAVLARWSAERRCYIVHSSAGTGGIGGPVRDRTLARLGTWGSSFDQSDAIRMEGIDHVDTRFTLPEPIAPRSEPEGTTTPYRSGQVSGPVRWTAYRLNHGHLVLTADFLEAPIIRYSARASSRAGQSRRRPST